MGELLLVGNEGAGKTLLCRQLDRCCKPLKDKRAQPPPVDAATQPSIGVELLHLVHKKKSFTVREVGGGMQPVWSRYFEGCGAVVFAVDTTSSAAAAAAAIEWYNLLASPPLKKKPMLLLLNKRDDSEALSEAMLQLALRIPECEDAASGQRNVGHLAVSALTGEGVPPLLDWMTEALTAQVRE